jgi:hypothetical protein
MPDEDKHKAPTSTEPHPLSLQDTGNASNGNNTFEEIGDTYGPAY